MAIDRKYGRVAIERGTIGLDEPVFVIRAQDRLAPELIEHYADLCRRAGSPDHHVAGVHAAAQEIREWQAGHHTQTPASA